MKIVIPGGSGQIGHVLGRRFAAQGHEVVVLARGADRVPGARVVAWDGRSIRDWTRELDGRCRHQTI